VLIAPEDEPEFNELRQAYSVTFRVCAFAKAVSVLHQTTTV
jgi:hypothetical protein